MILFFKSSRRAIITLLLSSIYNNQVWCFSSLSSIIPKYPPATITENTEKRNSATFVTTSTHRNMVATTPKRVNGDISIVPSTPAWDCDDEINCKEVPKCDKEKCRTTLDVRIHGEWFDLSGWRKRHPAGSHWIDWYDGRDGTEVMDAFHSKKGRNMYQRLPKTDPQLVSILDKTVPKETSTMLAFRKLRQQLEDDGWFERDKKIEVRLLGIWGSLFVGAAFAAHSIPALSIFLLGLTMTQAGWLGHDYVHGVDKWCDKMRQFTTIAGGLGCTWWSDKHNKHHALTNEQGVDEDIATDPFLYTWAPDPKHDSPLRKIQHLIFFIPFSALFALWRVDTISVIVNAVEEKRADAKKELYGLMIHYFVLLTLFPIYIWIPAVFLSGLMSALIVTPTHQSEDLFPEYQADWVSAQFLSTRNAKTTNPFSEWLWGGMQYQLEHHLFPSMPRSKYPRLKKILQKFAADNNIPGGYRESGEFKILKMNWDLYRRVAKADPVVGAPYSRGHGQLGAISLGNSPATYFEK